MSEKIHIGSMSREQALGILNKLIVAMKTYDGISPTQERINALQMAIDSLEVDEAYQLEYEQPEICEDCISREKVLDEITDYFDMESNLYKIIERMPSVLPKADNSVLENIKAEIESINDWAIRYAPTEDKDKRAQIVAKVKKHIISIVDKHISGKER